MRRLVSCVTEGLHFHDSVHCKSKGPGQMGVHPVVAPAGPREVLFGECATPDFKVCRRQESAGTLLSRREEKNTNCDKDHFYCFLNPRRITRFLIGQSEMC